jgi:anti-sigma factor ChrR (cupin superfamily)
MTGPDGKTGEDQAPWFVDEETDQFLAGLDLAMPAGEPPPGLWARIAGGMEGAESRLADGPWRAFAPGIRLKPLWTAQTFLLECEPGAVVPDHEHRSFEHVVVVSGDLRVDATTYGPGDYLGTPKGGDHPNWSTAKGCVVLVHYDPV